MTSPSATARRFRNVQCNIQQTDTAALTASHVVRVAKSGDVIGWNEAGTDAIRASISRLPGFTSFIPHGSAGSVCISWRDAVFTLLGTELVKVHNGVKGITPSRYIAAVHLRHEPSGLLVTRANTHVGHHIERNGIARTRATGAIPGQQERARRHFVMLRKCLARWLKRGPVILGGDFNVDYFAEQRARKRTPYFPLTQLGDVGRFAMPRHGTHGSRAIDWTVLAGPVRCYECRVLPRGSSDHNPVLSMIELQEKRYEQ